MRPHTHLGKVDLVQDGLIIGWAVDLSLDGQGAALSLYIDDDRAVDFVCDSARSDLAMIGLPHSKAGFQVAVPDRFQDGAPHSFSIRFADGVPLEVGEHAATATFTMPDPDGGAGDLQTLFGKVDGIEDGFIAGWAVNIMLDGQGTTLSLQIDGHLAAEFTCDADRLDLAAVGLPSTNAGFRVAIPEDFFDGKPHVYSIHFPHGEPIEMGYEHDGNLTSATFIMPSKIVEPSPTDEPSMVRTRHGQVDRAEDGFIVGWALDLALDGQAATMSLIIDEEPGIDFVCDSDRPDLVTVGLPPANAGFKVAVPGRFLDGMPHSFSVTFADGDLLHIANEAGESSTQGFFTMVPVSTLAGHVDGITQGAIRGWAVVFDSLDTVKRGGQDLAIRCDGIEVAYIKADKFRPDVAGVLGCDPYCGFNYVPHFRYRDGRAYVFEIILGRTGEPLSNSPITYQSPASLPANRIGVLANAVEKMSIQLWQVQRELNGLLGEQLLTVEEYDNWATQYQSAIRRRFLARSKPENAAQPLVTVLCPVYRPRLPDFRAALASVRAQTYQNWELILVDDRSDRPELTAIMEAACAADSRIRLISLKKNAGIAGATNIAIEAARGEYIALFDHDDLITDIAVEVMVEVAQKTGAKILYSDEDKIDDFGRFSDPHFKGAWNYRLLLGQNYVCHFLVVEAATLRAAGPLRKKYDGAQDHDLMLRLSEIVPPTDIVHVQEVLYHWRKTPGSTATTIAAKSYAVEAGELAIKDHLKRRGFKVKPQSMLSVTVYDIDWNIKEEPLVTIIIPFREQVAMTERCLTALLDVTVYGNFDIILVDNWSSSEEAAAFCERASAMSGVKVLRVEEPFNYSRLNNLAAASTPAEMIVFMNNDVIVDMPNWLRKMVNEALADPATAAVGAKLLYPDQSIQHGGVILGVSGVGDHMNRRRPVGDSFYVGRGICAHELSAVTAALMLCRAAAFRAVGGFDEAELAVAYNDIDLCLKFRAAGHLVIYCPSVHAVHHESVSRGDDMDITRLGRFIYEERVMFERWADVLAADPFYNANFALRGAIFDTLASAPLSPVSGEAIRFRAGGPHVAVGP